MEISSGDLTPRSTDADGADSIFLSDQPSADAVFLAIPTLDTLSGPPQLKTPRMVPGFEAARTKMCLAMSQAAMGFLNSSWKKVTATSPFKEFKMKSRKRGLFTAWNGACGPVIILLRNTTHCANGHVSRTIFSALSFETPYLFAGATCGPSSSRLFSYEPQYTWSVLT
eukprot:CAMPEP_0197125202 /NCGR_PEP_ID=MMETSP1390-20130617/8937_1 /TAXON_ID=38833 /ORGANISM="Micromonas sp., Strain CCMP2099" /LENGTH=168 /DNA_ID=CAMNT_0042567367 /DNA_START=104 /DNA_END=610 /DNA_ORIENTATION=+